jgi:hypothetical protein
MKRLAALVLLLCATSLSACSLAPSRNRLDEAQLLELHRAGLQAHIDGDLEALLAEQADDFVLVNRGELASPSRQQRREVLGPYLAATDFDYYRDKVPPVVRVARDGSLGSGGWPHRSRLAALRGVRMARIARSSSWSPGSSSTKSAQVNGRQSGTRLALRTREPNAQDITA